MKFDWTDDHVAEATRLWADGLSGSEIAKRMRCGVTRQAVIAKLWRLGVRRNTLAHRSMGAAQPRHAAASTAASSKSKSAVVLVVATPAPVVAPAAVLLAKAPGPILSLPETIGATVLTLAVRMCKWPIGDPAHDGFGFCGQARDGKSPYCAHHARVAYPAPSKRAARDAQGLVRLAGRYGS